MNNTKLGSIICCSIILIFTQDLRASLGDTVESIKNDQKTLLAVRHNVVSNDGYTVEEIASGAVTVREYVSASGVVFGVAWSGRIHPDLTQLLGSYFTEYQNAAAQNPPVRGRKNHIVKSDNLVVEKWGHPRNLQGHAFLTRLLPSGVSPDEIK